MEPYVTFSGHRLLYEGRYLRLLERLLERRSKDRNRVVDLLAIWQAPFSRVTSILKVSDSVGFVAANLPDIELLTLTASEK